MSRNVRMAVLGLALLLPALVLVSSGFLGQEPARALVNPVLVLGGLLLSFALNAILLLRIRIGQNEGVLIGTVSLRLRGAALNLTAMSLSCLLLATVAAYVFVENFQPR